MRSKASLSRWTVVCLFSSGSESTIPIIAKAKNYQNKVAVIDAVGTYTYKDLLDKSAKMATVLQNKVGGG